jgi:hypothetical protein
MRSAAVGIHKGCSAAEWHISWETTGTPGFYAYNEDTFKRPHVRLGCASSGRRASSGTSTPKPLPVEALWRAWEHLRLDGATGISVWWSDHADHHMNMLLNPDGPFRQSDMKAHRDPEHLERNTCTSRVVPRCTAPGLSVEMRKGAVRLTAPTALSSASVWDAPASRGRLDLNSGRCSYGRQPHCLHLLRFTDQDPAQPQHSVLSASARTHDFRRRITAGTRVSEPLKLGPIREIPSFLQRARLTMFGRGSASCQDRSSRRFNFPYPTGWVLGDWHRQTTPMSGEASDQPYACRRSAPGSHIFSRGRAWERSQDFLAGRQAGR